MASFLPETLNQNMPERAEDSAKFGQDKPYFSLAITTKVYSNRTNIQSVPSTNEEQKNQKQNQFGSIPIIKIELKDSSSPTSLTNNNINNNN